MNNPNYASLSGKNSTKQIVSKYVNRRFWLVYGFDWQHTMRKEVFTMNEEKPTSEITLNNPIQAASEIFYKPLSVFNALSVRENWSWIPFILVAFILFIPPYLYFGLVDFDWWLDAAMMPSLEDLPPSQQENILAQYSPSQMQWTGGLSSSLILLLIYALKAFYFSMMTRDDEKNVQGFTDWYGAMWWMAMPMLLNALVSLILLTLHDPGAQLSAAVIAPLSVAFVLGTDMASPWFNLFVDLRIDVIWSILLGYVCVKSWTNFSQTKALIVAIIPAVFYWLILIIAALLT